MKEKDIEDNLKKKNNKSFSFILIFFFIIYKIQ